MEIVSEAKNTTGKLSERLIIFKSATFANFKHFPLLIKIKRFLPAELQIMIQPNHDPQTLSISQAVTGLKTWGTLPLDIKILKETLLTKFEHSYLLIKTRRQKQSDTQFQQ